MFSLPHSDQNTTIIGTKAEPASIRKHSRSPLRPRVSSGLTPLASQTSMAGSQWNTRYSAPGSELPLKLPISNSSLSHCGTNSSSNFCRIRSTMRHSHTPNTDVLPLSSATWLPGTRSS
ncbi:hypothetical protein TNCV_3456571 [Trichonephila clavipes]|nr:hypothetical protein TNCV_3456571 [Trichonephila clavipes]